MMGCSQGDEECFENEKPSHEVEITRGFWMQQTEVTQAAYEVATKANPSRFRGDYLPVENVTWFQANQYCEAVGAHVPTEAQWEYAARGGSKVARFGPLDQIAWYLDNSSQETHRVATKAPNGWGLYDTLGNVWEWTSDWYDKYYFQFRAVKDPQAPYSPMGDRVVRGGAGGRRYSHNSRLGS